MLLQVNLVRVGLLILNHLLLLRRELGEFVRGRSLLRGEEGVESMGKVGLSHREDEIFVSHRIHVLVVDIFIFSLAGGILRDLVHKIVRR